MCEKNGLFELLEPHGLAFMSEKILIFTQVFPRPKIVYLENFPYIFDPPSHFSWSKSVQDLFAEIAHSREGQFAATRVENKATAAEEKSLFLMEISPMYLSFSSYVLRYVKHLKYDKFKFWSILTKTVWPQNETIS